MTATVEQARDQIIKQFSVLWKPRKIVYDDLKENKPEGRDPWARVTVRHTNGGQSTISRIAGKSRYSRTGTVYVNIFTAPGDGLRLSDPLTKIALDAYEGQTTAGGVWFTKVRVRELGVVDSQYQVNVLADFSYDEIK